MAQPKEGQPTQVRDRGAGDSQREPAERSPDVEHGDDLPIGVQLAWRLEALIRSGGLAPGERLPGVRELAAGAGVNVNTARSVYRRLEREGLTISIQGRGTFVAPAARVSPALAQLAADAADAARSQGVDPRELARTLYAASAADGLDPLEMPAEPGDEIPARPGGDELDFDRVLTTTEAGEGGARRTLRGQIARLEAELAVYPEAAGGEAQPQPLGGPAPHVAGVGELEQVRDQLVERLKRARAAEERRGARQSAARGRLEEILRDPAANKWETVSNAEIGDPGCARWEVKPAWGPVGALMNWWRVKVSSGCPLAGSAGGEKPSTEGADGQNRSR
jgi:DNA-binding transcriptional regulator YhcF (GntR family)